MSVSVTMPQLGESVTEGTITRWLKNVGDHVTADEPLVEVSTDKVDTEIPSPATGILLSLSAQEDDVVEVGSELAVIGEASEAGSHTAAPAPAAPAPVMEEVVEPAVELPAVVEQTVAPTQTTGAETIITLPALGESVTEGTITRWLKAVGDTVAADEPIVEISTDKVDTEIPAPAAGILTAITAPEDAVIEVGAELGRIGSSVGAPASAPSAAPAAPAAPASAPAKTPETPAAPATSDSPGYVTPLVRKMAADAGIDLTSVRGTGAGGRITKADVQAAAGSAPAAAPAASAPQPAAPAAPVTTAPVTTPAAPTPAVTPAAKPAPQRTAGPIPGTTEPLSRLRKVIAERMVESLQTSAQLTTVIEVDVTRIAALRNSVKKTLNNVKV